MAAPRRAAVLFIGEDQIAALLRLPEGWSIAGVRDDFLRNGVMVRIVGDALPTCAPGSEPYRLPDLSLYYTPPPEDAPQGAAGTFQVIVPDWPDWVRADS